MKKKLKFENKKTENLVAFLIILIVTLIVINKIMAEDSLEKEEKISKSVDFINSDNTQNDLEKKLENILEKIEGVGKVSVLITYSESSSICPLYNETSSVSVSEETVETGNKKTTETNENQKEILVDSASNPIIEKSAYPKIEGAIITAQGARNSLVKSNIVSAVEAVTGLATHKIQVFSMN